MTFSRCCAFILIIAVAKARKRKKSHFSADKKKAFSQSHLARCSFQGHRKSEKCRALCVFAACCHVACGMGHLWGLGNGGGSLLGDLGPSCSLSLKFDCQAVAFNMLLLFRLLTDAIFRPVCLEWEFFCERQPNNTNSQPKSIK